MSASNFTRPAADYTAITLERLHSREFWDGVQSEWLPRRALFELQVGPALSFSRVWREVHIDLESGPEYLYRYFPFTSFVYVDGRAQVALEFDAPLQQQRATIRVPVGAPMRIVIVTELATAPATIGHGDDGRELALRLAGVSLGEMPANAPAFARAEPREHFELDLWSSGEEQPRPVFVIGAYRSGTSVLTWALGQHPDIWPMEETGWISPLADAAILGYRNAKTAARGFFDVYDVSRREYYTQMGHAIDAFCRRVSRRNSREILLGRLSGKTDDFNQEYQLSRSVMNPKTRWVDGTPENSGYVTSLRAVFPFARFIGLVRNPLDVVASMLRFERAGGQARSVADAAQMWLSTMRMVLLAYRAFGPSVVHLVPYESLTNELELTLREVFDFLGEPHFAKAAQTFAKRINSSQISGDERGDLYREIDAEPSKREEMLALYRDLIDASAQPWESDQTALDELIDVENDRIMRIALEYRGGEPLPSE